MKSEPRAPVLKPLAPEDMISVGRRDVAADPMYRALRKRALEGEGPGCEWPPGSLGNLPPNTFSRFKERAPRKERRK